VNRFCPDGYVPAQEAIVRAAEYWFPKRFAALERAAAPQSETKPDNSFEALARALSQPPGIPDAWRPAFEEIASETVHRLRSFLHRGELKAYYFGHHGCQSVSREFWATTHADGVMESGTYWPFGEPTRLYERPPNYPLFLLQSELDAQLSEQPAKKPGLPGSKMSDLVAALLTLDSLPNREKQREALRKLPEFERYHLTDEVLREAEKQVPRKPGRKPLRPKQ
jgi:hypothetical protein